MEHAADIRHKAHAIDAGPLDMDELGYCEGNHIHPDDLLWFQDTIDDLLDEIDRRPPA